MLAPNGILSLPPLDNNLISTVESLTLTPTMELSSLSFSSTDSLTTTAATATNTATTEEPPNSFQTIPSRPILSSRNSSSSTSNSTPLLLSSPSQQSNSKLFASRPSPVVPSVPASPSFSRPTSPGNHSVGITGSPANKSSNDLGLSGSGFLPNNNNNSNNNNSMGGSHIFERDVEFPSRHHISPSEAVDVAIPAVLDEAALALNTDNLSSLDFTNYLRESSDAGSGWSSPVLNYNHQSLSHSPPNNSITATNTSTTTTSSNSRSPNRNSHPTGIRGFSPDRINGSRGASPSGASSASFSISTPSNSPPNSFHPFIQHLSEALQSEANSNNSSGLNSTSANNLTDYTTNTATSCVTEAKPSLSSNSSSGSNPLVFPSTSSNSPFNSESSPSVGSLLFGRPNLNDNDSHSSTNSTTLEPIPIRSSRLSFTSYADILNEERLGELLGNPREG